MCSNPLTPRAITSFSIALEAEKLNRLLLSFSEEDITLQPNLESELIQMICVGMNSCTINIGSVNTRIGALAKVQYYNNRSKKKQEEQSKNGPSWQNDLKSSKLSHFLGRDKNM